MAWQVSKRIWKFIKNDKKVKQGERLMLLALADIADEHGICLPKFDTSYSTLGEMAGVNRRSAMRIVDDLCRAGHVIKVDTVGRGHSNIYVVTVGLTEAEIKSTLSKIGVTDNTNLDEESGQKTEEMVLPETPIKKEKVSPVTPGGVTHNTNSGLNGVTHNTHPIKSPSVPSLSSKDDSGNKPPATEKSGVKNKSSPPPSVEVYRSVANRFPDKATWGMIDAGVGEVKEDLDFWRLVVRDYIASGFNKTNVKTMLEYFERRELPKTKQGKKGSKQSGQSATRTGKPGAIAAAQRAARDSGE
jgi:hypothetical protein